MQTSLKSTAVILIAATSGWLVRGVAHEQPPNAVAPTVHAAVTTQAVAATPPLHIDHLGVPPEPQGGKRNLFAYVEAPTTPPHVEAIATPVASFVAPTPIEPVVAKPEPPQFPYRCIGRFGTDRTRLAAFTRDGVVVTVRAGERIDPQWSLRRIGMESVEVEASTGERLSVKF
jgi:hypothetical protein